MLELKLTTAALKALFGGAQVIVADVRVAPIVQRHTAAAFTVLSVDDEGRLYTQDEEDGRTACHKVQGMSASVCAFVLTDASKAVYAEWGAERLLARGHGEMPVLVVPHNPLEAVQLILAFILEVQNGLFSKMAGNVSALEEQVVYLRQSSERMMTTLSVAKRVMDSVGYDDIMPVASLVPGDRGLDLGECAEKVFSQLLPVDGLGLVALSFFVRAPGSGEGQVTLSLRRDFDGKILAHMETSRAALQEGWNRFEFDDILTDVMGDVRLDIRWQAAEGTQAPEFAFAAAKADRFGRDGGETLALQLFKRVFRPDLAANRLEETAASSSLVQIETQPGLFPSRLGFYGGETRLQAAASELPFAPLQYSGTDGWVQAHIASDGVTGLTFALPVSVNDRSLTLRVTFREGQASGAVVRALYVPTLENIEAVMHAYASGEALANGILGHCTMLLGAEKTKELTLALPAGAEGSGFLVLFAQTLDNSSACGWLRLEKIRRDRQLPAASRDRLPADAQSDQRWMVRAMRLPELSGLVEFIEGPETLEALSVNLGFSPMLLEENGGFLQTHPLKDRISAAVVPTLAGPGTRKLVATATTAHPAAPDFIYIFAIRPHDGQPVKAAMDKVAGLAADSALQGCGQQCTDGVVWTACKLSATETRRLELDFSTPLDGAHDVIFATLTIDGQYSYGWCRWTSLGIISADGSVHG